MPSSPMFRFDWMESLTIPIRRVGERWECFYGGDVPVKQGALGELTIRTGEITDQEFLARMTQATRVRILEEGTPLMVALSDRAIQTKAQWPDVAREDVPPGTTRFERITIGPPKAPRPPLQTEARVEPLFIGPPQRRDGGLWLQLRGLDRSELMCSTVMMPDAFHEKTALSLNHAFTLLSRAYETHRISNTGNVYRQVFYQETNDRWYPLADLRNGVRVQSERALIEAVWQQIEVAIGWRPAIAESGGKKKRRE